MKPIPIKCTTTPIINEVYLSPVMSQEVKNAASDGTVIIAPIIEPLRNNPFIGLFVLSTNNFFQMIIKIKIFLLYIITLYLPKGNLIKCLVTKEVIPTNNLSIS